MGNLRDYQGTRSCIKESLATLQTKEGSHKSIIASRLEFLLDGKAILTCIA